MFIIRVLLISVFLICFTMMAFSDFVPKEKCRPQEEVVRLAESLKKAGIISNLEASRILEEKGAISLNEDRKIRALASQRGLEMLPRIHLNADDEEGLSQIDKVREEVDKIMKIR